MRTWGEQGKEEPGLGGGLHLGEGGHAGAGAGTLWSWCGDAPMLAQGWRWCTARKKQDRDKFENQTVEGRNDYSHCFEDCLKTQKRLIF